RLNKVVEELLSFARPDASELEANFIQVNINDVIEQTLILAAHDSKKEKIRIIKQFSSDVPLVLADAKKLQQAFLNIIFNAFSAMGVGGDLTIKTDFNKNTKVLNISFADTGTGISEEGLKKVFDPFYTAKASGTGLGLTIAHQIISSHQGKIDVKSEMGQGATFTISLPEKR
ncbi:MAG: ATP-binding protein, partial [Candidatus Omnitrophica bacterium]|nr:ATP-binding protein [Candidatus Omnitrophota bacterium]